MFHNVRHWYDVSDVVCKRTFTSREFRFGSRTVQRQLNWSARRRDDTLITAVWLNDLNDRSRPTENSTRITGRIRRCHNYDNYVCTLCSAATVLRTNVDRPRPRVKYVYEYLRVSFLVYSGVFLNFRFSNGNQYFFLRHLIIKLKWIRVHFHFRYSVSEWISTNYELAQ